MTLHDRTTKSLLHLHKKKKPPSISAQFQVGIVAQQGPSKSVLFQATFPKCAYRCVTLLMCPRYNITPV